MDWPKRCEIFGAGVSEVVVVVGRFGGIGDGDQPAQRHHQVHRAVGEGGGDRKRPRFAQRPKLGDHKDSATVTESRPADRFKRVSFCSVMVLVYRVACARQSLSRRNSAASTPQSASFGAQPR